MRDGAWHCAAGGTRCSLPAQLLDSRKKLVFVACDKKNKNVLLPPAVGGKASDVSARDQPSARS
jgi:hypothetical protein